MSPNAPLLIRALWALTWAMSQRRRVLRFWCYLDTGDGPVAVRNALYWATHPRMALKVRRYRRAFAAGQDIVEA